MKHIIYCLSVVIDGETFLYFGKHSTNNIDDNYMGSSSIIKLLLRTKIKTQVPDFQITKTILCEVESEDLLNEIEMMIIDCAKEKYQRHCINIAEGGTGGNTGKHKTKEERSRIARKRAEKYKGIPRSKETIDKIKNFYLKNPKVVSIETRNLISTQTKKNMKLKNSGEKISRALTGKKRSSDSLRKFNKTFSELQKYPWLNMRARTLESQIMWSLSPQIYEIHLENPNLKDSKLKRLCIDRGIKIPEKCRLYSMLKWFENNDPRKLPVPVIE